MDTFESTPGTFLLIDSQNEVPTKHARGTGTEQDIVLVPAPSSHPDDPLNWSPRRKKLCALCMAAYVLVIGFCSSSLYSVLDPLSKATGLSYGDLNSGTGYMFLLLGWGCPFWQAIAVQYGKRPVYLITLAGTLGVMVWQPHITSNGQWIAAKILQGFLGAPIESIAEITVSDVFFTHERGTYMALYALALGYSNGLAPLTTGFINDGQGYQWVFYWCAIFCGICFVLVFFCMEETKFKRVPYLNEETPSNPQPTSSKTNKEKHTNSEQKEDASITADHLEASPTNATGHTSRIDPSIHKKSFFAKLKPIESTGFHQKNHLLRLMFEPFQLLRFPIVVYAGLLYGCNIVWLTVLNATESMVLSNPPYNMSTSMVGLTFIAPLIGTSLAACYTGLFGDHFILRLSRRNNGFFQAEYRLWLFIPSLILIPFGCILFGVGAYHEVHWMAMVFAMGVISFTTTAGSQMSIAYCVDCYRDLGGEALAAVIVIRNSMSFGIGYGVTPWVVNLGYQNAFILGAFAGLAHNLTIFPVIKWGMWLRRRSAGRYWRKVKEIPDVHS
ncbi:putative MFS transporter [Aspergillus karnatakaensis]|uniref:putative MFS transporter n=1 Tax=Aspergillus karnatakaensis TaxID=1810916 RepID=UPI003CCDFAC0